MIEYPAKLENLEFFIKEAKSVSMTAGLSPSEVGRVELCVEEVVVNIINYAYPEGEEGFVRMECSNERDAVIIKIEDAGIAFDMSQKEDPDISSDAEDRAIGGLGVFLVKELMDEVIYSREENLNVLVLRKNII